MGLSALKKGDRIKKVDTLKKTSGAKKKTPASGKGSSLKSRFGGGKKKRAVSFSFFKKYLKKTALLLAVVLFFVLFFAAVGLSSLVFAHKYESRNRVYFGTNFMGEELGGLEGKHLSRKIEAKLAGVEIAFEIEGEELVYSAEEVGIVFEVGEIRRKILERNQPTQWHRDFLKSGLSFLHGYGPEIVRGHLEETKRDIAAEYVLDDEKLKGFVAGLSDKYRVQEKNAGLVMNGSVVRVIPATYGKRLVVETVREQIKEAFESGGSKKILIRTEEVNPEILEEDTKTAILEAQRMLERTVVFSYQDKVYRPDRATVGGWIVFVEKNGRLEPQVDSGRVRGYLGRIAEEINVPAVNGKVKIINGVEREQVREGKNGLAVDVNSLAADTSSLINNGSDVRREVPTYTVKYKTEVNNVLVADWSKYIDIQISTQRMCAYLAGGDQQRCFVVTTGANRWPSPIGTFLISRKAGAGGWPGPNSPGICMPNPPSTEPLCGINYVSYFTPQGHAIHEAWWRPASGANRLGNPNFGLNGSHGCINATYDAARWIYNWAPIGTPVVIRR